MRDEWLASDDSRLLRECRLEFRKASGNGGQKVNKTSSAVRLHHEPSGVSVTSSESRSQHENRLHALKALRMKIALSFRLPPDPQFRIGEPATSLHNPGYPLWAAKLLDRFQFQEGDLKSAAASLEISPSRLARLLRRDPVLWTEANRIRAAFSLPPLKSME